jgi:hypothetical protein
MEAIDWIKAGIAGLAVLAVYLAYIIGKPRQAPLPRSFAVTVLFAVVITHVLASAILPTRPDLSRQMIFVETGLGRADIMSKSVRWMRGDLRRAGAGEAATGTPLQSALNHSENILEVLGDQATSLKKLGRDLSARSSRVLPEHRTMFDEAQPGSAQPGRR